MRTAIFVISDCKPYLCDTDIEVLDNNLHHNIKEAKQNKVKVFGLGFFPDLQHFYGQCGLPRFLAFNMDLDDWLSFVLFLHYLW